MLLECLQRFLVKDRPEFVPDIPDDTEEKDRDPQMEMKAALAEHRSVGNSNSPCSKTPMMPPACCEKTSCRICGSTPGMGIQVPSR